MALNPEFRRNLQLEFSSTRMIATPIIILMIFAVTVAADYSLARFNRNGFDTDITTGVAQFLFYVFTIAWGGRQAAGCVAQEISRKTWDWQRLSTQNAWSLAWAKLFGATAFTWCCGLFCLAVFVAGGFFTSKPTAILPTAILMIGVGVFCHGLGLMISLLGVGNRPGQKAGNVTLSHLAAIFATLLIYYLAVVQEWTNASWYGLFEDLRWFRALTFVFFGSWAVVGAYRQMRRVLQLRNIPWVWLLFLITYVAYMMGLTVESRSTVMQLLLPVWLVSFFVYPLILAERKDPMGGAAILSHLGRGKIISALGLMPLWALTAIVTYVLLAASVTASFFDDWTFLAGQIPEIANWVKSGASIRLHLIALGIFLLRDILLVMVFAYGRDSFGAAAYGAIFWFLLYGPIPLVLALARFEQAYTIFYPITVHGWAWQLLPVAGVTLLLLVLFILRWRAYLAWSGEERQAATPPAAVKA